MPRRVLIVAPHFAPINAPDGHRARLLLPWLPACGWEPTVLTVRADRATAPIEPELAATIPAGTLIHRVGAIAPDTSRRFGVGNLGWRCLPWIWREGSRLLASGAYDLVYFSTTQFACVPLGRYWRRRFGTPYVIDLQDPWHNVYYARANAPAPPGGWKYRFASATTRSQEGWTLRRCSHVITVSTRYVDDLRARRPWFNSARTTVLPFGWSERDQEVARQRTPVAPPGKPSVLYIGRVGEDMAPLLRVLFSAYREWRRARQPQAAGIHWNFTGTSYAAGSSGGGTAARLAAELGLARDVSEDPSRVGYLDALSRQQASPANLVLGSDDLGYSPSKLWPTLAAGRPWLACAWKGSVLADRLAPHAQAGMVLLLQGAALGADQHAPLFQWFDRLAAGATIPCERAPALQAFHADQLAQRHAEIFNAVTR